MIKGARLPWASIFHAMAAVSVSIMLSVAVSISILLSVAVSVSINTFPVMAAVSTNIFPAMAAVSTNIFPAMAAVSVSYAPKEITADKGSSIEIMEDSGQAGAQEPENSRAGVQEPENSRAGAQEPEDGQAGKWKSRNQRFFYYENGKKVKGLKSINGNYYYFDSKGIQCTGWQKYKGDYYFFQIANENKGFMVRSKTVNGITLAKDGKAKLTSQNSKKLDVMVKATEIIEKATRPAMSKPEKLQKSFTYLTGHYQYRGSPTFQQSGHWEQDYALQMFHEGHGSCYAYGAAFAFLANAAGYQNCYAVSSGGHGWAEVNGKVYDPSWCLVDTRHNYYGVDFSLSGVDGRPNYRRARRFVVKI